MPLPSFIVIGASRSGTTSLHHYLDQHPEIFICPRKSPNFFVAEDPVPAREGRWLRRMADQWVSDRDTYESLFAAADEGQLVGEVSPVYLQSCFAAARIRRLCPDARLVAVLRDPAERAWAHFLGRRRDGLERRRDFAAVVESEIRDGLPREIAFGSYVGCSQYGLFLETYFENFRAEQLRVCLFDDLRRDPRAFLREILSFLEVDPAMSETVRLSRHNRSGVISSRWRRLLWTGSVGLRTILRPYLPERIRRLGQRLALDKVDKAPLAPAVRARICDVLAPDIDRCARLIGRDLSAWAEA